MYELKTNTAVRIAVGPLVDPGDGKTAETGLTVTDLAVEIFQIKNDGSAVVRAAFSPTASGGNNDMVHVTDDTTGMYDLELTAAQLNFLGNARIAFYDVDGFLVHWIDLQIVSAGYFDWKYGSTIPDVNVTQISGDATAADNCELMFDGTGYAGGTARLKVDLDTIKTQAVTCGAGVIVAPYVGNATAAIAVDGSGYVTYANAAPPSAATIADAVWDEALAGHAVAGSAGAALSTAGTAGDPWSTALPGSYAEGTAGEILGGLSVSTASAIADAVLEEGLAAHTAVAGSLAEALNDLHNRSCGKVIIDRDAGTIAVYDADAETLLYTLTMVTVDDQDTITRA
jgi:hypothetical protein